MTTKIKKVLKALDKDVKNGLAFSGPSITWDTKSVKGMVEEFGKEQAIMKLAGDQFQGTYVRKVVNKILLEL